jgi:5-formyltetrahydrofolate cyclo-ligase
MDDALSRKAAIRARILAERSGLEASDRARRSAAICAAIETVAGFAEARDILFYMPFRGEVDVSPLLRGALRRGARCALPRCAPGRSLRFFRMSDPQADVEPGYKGVPEPKECLNECNAGDFSVIIVPGAAFDRQGWRLGYGAGYYDRLLEGAGRGALKIAPAYAFQVLDALPHLGHDVPVDIVVTEEEIIDCRRAGGETNG